MKKIVLSKDAPAPIGPYSQAVIHGNTLYVSGQIAIDQSTGNMITDNIEAETDQVMKNLGFILKEAGVDYDQIIKCSIFVSDMGNFAKINEVYGKYFPENPPARETVEVSCLPKNVNVEISCIAYI
ncbi:MAG: reactive intermediate/imine deaminase [Flammeovirgaceae bacterium]|nr:reactive intermediate/imine deaminase [Flammeovirgaceae bacterium]HCX25182.1 reactive intermediate/imine deaminase [Cytophagales bacterium]|tara:strand:- start:103 stop:480 length:378 start_codon:yes stop_codon:yes gene_type:complete